MKTKQNKKIIPLHGIYGLPERYDDDDNRQ